MQVDVGRLLTMRAAAKLDTGDFARKEVSMAKVVVSEALHTAIDTAIQLLGARGYSKDTKLEWMYRYARSELSLLAAMSISAKAISTSERVFRSLDSNSACFSSGP